MLIYISYNSNSLLYVTQLLTAIAHAHDYAFLPWIPTTYVGMYHTS